MMDPAMLQTALGLVAATTGATNGAVEVIQKIKNLVGSTRASPELDALVNDLSNKLTSANLMNLQLSESLRGLSGQIGKEAKFEEQKEKYELVETNMGDIVWEYRYYLDSSQPRHFACPVCMTDGIVSYISGKSHFRMCQRCGKGFDFDPAPDFTNGSSNGWS